MAGTVPGPLGKEPKSASLKNANTQIHGAGHAPGHAAPATAAHTMKTHPQQGSFHLPTDDGLHVRYLYLYGGDPACEVWVRKHMVCPPPRLMARANPNKDDSFYREGDTIFSTKIHRHSLHLLGFKEEDSSPFTGLLFFLLDIDTSDEYTGMWVFKKIYPGTDQWSGRVVFSRFVVAGSTVIPLPNRTDQSEDFAVALIWLGLADQLTALEKIITAYMGVMIDILWGIFGGWEVKVAAEVTEKYVGREVLKWGLKFLKPKFVAVVKAYITGFVKELVTQIFKQYLYMIRSKASDALASRANSDTITIDRIHWLQSAGELKELSEKSSIDWYKCHGKGAEEALTPFWKLFANFKVINGPFRRFVDACFGYVEKFFFDLGLKRVIEKVEGPIGKKIRSEINKLVADVTTDWMKELSASPKGMSEHASEQKVRELTLRKLTDGTLVELAVNYIKDNWDKLAVAALQKAESELMKVVKDADGGKVEHKMNSIAEKLANQRL